MIKIFYFFKIKFRFAKDEVLYFSIQCNCCNKTVICKFSETTTIYILPFFIKTIVLYHVGLSWMILTKEQYEFSAEEILMKSVQEENGLIRNKLLT